MENSPQIQASGILTGAFLRLRPFDNRGALINEVDYLAGKVIVSADSRLTYGKTRYAGSVERLLAFIDGRKA